MIRLVTIAALISSLLPEVSAHYRWTALITNGVTTPDFQYVRPYAIYSAPVTDPLSTDIRCNKGATPAPLIATVAAGSALGFKLDQPISHHGVINVYLGKAPAGTTAATWDGSGQYWFKVAQVGAVISGGTVTFPADGITQYLFKIPARTPPGDYLARIEHIAYASGSSYPVTCKSSCCINHR
ncbi:hypothetical protein FRC03_005833 [Tulasnella sp. 419]|nr:hypothetical protein FRC03_005833 [Tulasnella sp. 419]